MSVKENLKIVLEEIEKSKRNRKVAVDENVTLVAVTKNHGVDVMPLCAKP